MQNNPQYIRTDKAIKQALITLLKNKPFEKITIQDILDETPVTRSTFYKHFHDKYEIAEKMQQEFFDSLITIRKEIYENPNQTPALIKISQENRELMEALLKIHTEHVDLHRTFNNLTKEYYYAGITGEHPELEAEVFSAAITAYQLALGKTDILEIELMHDVFISITLRILGIPEDEELRKLLKKKILLPTNPYKNVSPLKLPL